MLIAHKIELDLNNKQRTYMAKACGVARFAYNWALAEWKRQYEAWKLDNALEKPNQMALRRQLNAVKRADYPWMLEVTKCAPQLAIMQLGVAFKNFFSGRARYPVPRKKGVHDRFSISNDQFAVKGKRFRVPNLGWVRMREALRFTGRIVSATVSRVADSWFVSITVSVPDPTEHCAENQGAVGVDLGINAMATLSNGDIIPGAKPHTALLGKLRRLSRSLSRKVKGSKNRSKARAKLARLYARMSNIRRDCLHQLTTYLARNFSVIGIESLNVKGMLRNRRLSRSVADMGFFEFRRQLEYKAGMYGGVVHVADKWFPSSKMCSDCGYVLPELSLGVRQWQCPECGAEHHRDINAALNLRNLALTATGT